MSTPVARDGLVLLEVDGPIATITINRPAVRNAMDRDAAEAMSAIVDELDAREDLRAAVLTGAGGFFCAGMDLKALAATGQRPVTGRGSFGITAAPPRTPVVAAVEGAALGGGFEIALACDMIVAGESARFGVPEVKRGLVAAGGGLLRLADRLPRNLALELVTTGEPITAARAHELGLVNRVVPDGGALAAATALAQAVASGAPLAVAMSKRLVDESVEWPRADWFARQDPMIQSVRDSADAKEGATAFVEKRPPVWSGR